MKTEMQQAWNRGKRRGNYSSQYKGVYWRSDTNKWTASVTREGKTYRKVFENEADANNWAIQKRKELHGKFACN